MARASAGDVTYLVAVLDRLAGILVEHGDPRPVEVLRAEALRILGNPARALALLVGAELDAADPTRESATELSEEALFPSGSAGWMRDAAGDALPGAPRVEHLPERPLTDADLARLTAAGATVAPTVGEPVEPAAPGADAALLRSVLPRSRPSTIGGWSRWSSFTCTSPTPRSRPGPGWRGSRSSAQSSSPRSGTG